MDGHWPVDFVRAGWPIRGRELPANCHPDLDSEIWFLCWCFYNVRQVPFLRSDPANVLGKLEPEGGSKMLPRPGFPLSANLAGPVPRGIVCDISGL